ncbi:Calcineurin-like phosphoesterase [Poriferisphaera corsica]|uniref:Calcineurin-like phosphoesterase n=1 Tax=Poriferisphaera corsica TaxID=2528020 RepID=A0A517YVG4_9BACT|nr:metallophosphoesterase [Poriferisphaera corsica]QDU34220.1 Calcineurin-like phosphoesterase [Poriferisphaera corsica]
MRNPNQRILYITDTHVGANLKDGYYMQGRCTDEWEAIIDVLRGYIADQKIDMVLHGGDLVDTADEQIIALAAKSMRSLGVPVTMCFGNHDLDHVDARKSWYKIASDLLPQGTHTGGICGDKINVFVISHHYASNNPPHYWDMKRTDAQIPVIDETQRATLELFVAASDKPVIIVTHCPVHGISAEQTGDTEFHPANKAYANYLYSLAAQSGNVPLILSAHNHVSSVQRHLGFVTMTTGGLTEVPCSARLLTIDDEKIKIEQVDFAGQLGLLGKIDESKKWVAGMAKDRCIEIDIKSNDDTGDMLSELLPMI